MLQYHELLRLVLEKGKFKADRTGTGTWALFGAQARFPLPEGSPEEYHPGGRGPEGSERFGQARGDPRWVLSPDNDTHRRGHDARAYQRWGERD